MLSAIDWWREAGVDTLVDDAPRDWLATVSAPVAPIEALPSPTYPATLALFRSWLIEADFALAGPPASRLASAGDPASGLMVIADVPEIGDVAAGHLLSGAVGLLFDRMLAAIGRDRASIYLTTLCVSRTPDGKIDAEGCAALAPITRHHIGLVQPRAILLLGDCVTNALLGRPVVGARGGIRNLNQTGANMACVATFHPRFLFDHPAFKAQAWTDLRLISGELSR